MTPLYCTGRLLALIDRPAAPPHAQGQAADVRPATGTEPVASVMAAASADPPDPIHRDSRFGAWWATLVPLRPARLVLAVSEHAQVPIVLAALPVETLPHRLADAVYALLLDIKVPADLARLERASMRLIRPQACSQRDNGALGVLKATTGDLETIWNAGVTRAPLALSFHLATLPSANLAGATPAQAARRRLHLLPDQTEALGL